MRKFWFLVWLVVFFCNGIGNGGVYFIISGFLVDTGLCWVYINDKINLGFEE